PSSSSKLESPKANVVFPPSGPVTHGFCRTNGVARGLPTLSNKIGIFPADEKSSAQAGLQRGDPSAFRKRPNGSAGLSFHSTVGYQAAAPLDAAPCALACPYAEPLRVSNSSTVVVPVNWKRSTFHRLTWELPARA